MARWTLKNGEFIPVVGPQGPAGPAGQDGAAGPEGQQGPQGPQGEPGDTHVPDPALQPNNHQLKVSTGALVYDSPGIAIAGSTATPITDVNAPRPDAGFVLWFAEVQPSNAANVDLIIRTDEAI